IKEEFHDLNQAISPKTDLAAHTTNYIFTSALHHTFDPGHTNKTGITWTNMHYDMTLDFTPFFGQPLEKFNQSSGSTNLIAAYSQSLFRIRHNLTLTTGLNVQYLALNGNTSVEPRASIRWQA